MSPGVIIAPVACAFAVVAGSGVPGGIIGAPAPAGAGGGVAPDISFENPLLDRSLIFLEPGPMKTLLIADVAADASAPVSAPTKDFNKAGPNSTRAIIGPAFFRKPKNSSDVRNSKIFFPRAIKSGRISGTSLLKA